MDVCKLDGHQYSTRLLMSELNEDMRTKTRPLLTTTLYRYCILVFK